GGPAGGDRGSRGGPVVGALLRAAATGPGASPPAPRPRLDAAGDVAHHAVQVRLEAAGTARVGPGEGPLRLEAGDEHLLNGIVEILQARRSTPPGFEGGADHRHGKPAARGPGAPASRAAGPHPG